VGTQAKALKHIYRKPRLAASPCVLTSYGRAISFYAIIDPKILQLNFSNINIESKRDFLITGADAVSILKPEKLLISSKIILTKVGQTLLHIDRRLLSVPFFQFEL
jgi:hypothetical protein